MITRRQVGLRQFNLDECLCVSCNVRVVSYWCVLQLISTKVLSNALLVGEVFARDDFRLCYFVLGVYRLAETGYDKVFPPDKHQKTR